MSKFWFRVVLYLLFCLPNLLFAQIKVERYCEVTVYFGRVKSIEVTVDYGKINSPTFNDSTVVNRLVKLTKFNSVVDILNHMSKDGWSLVTISVLDYPRCKVYYFKREFNVSEVASDNSQ